jgi:hypothetical protein
MITKELLSLCRKFRGELAESDQRDITVLGQSNNLSLFLGEEDHMGLKNHTDHHIQEVKKIKGLLKNIRILQMWLAGV